MAVTDIPESRRENMRRIRSESSVERRLRSLLHRAGYRFRKNLAGLPGRPDVAFPARKKAVFLHGCFWHQHAGCKRATKPRSRSNYWQPKLAKTTARDACNLTDLSDLGWSVLIVWECELRDEQAATKRLTEFLGPPRLVY